MTVLLFAGAEYYPAGGWDDFVGEFQNADAAKAHIDHIFVGAGGDKYSANITLANGAQPNWLGWAHIVEDHRIVSEWDADHPRWAERASI